MLVLLCLTPVMGAALIGVSRLEDYRHDVGDVMVGAAIGSVAAYLNWRRYYPSLLDKRCDEPFDPPEKGGYQRAARDEEEMVGVGFVDGEEGDSGGTSRSGSGSR